MDEQAMREDRTRSARPSHDLTRWIWVAAAVVFAFVIGFGLQAIRARQIEARLDHTRQALMLHRLEGSLAAANFEARRGSYEIARQHASDFFTGLQGTIDQVPETARNDLTTILSQRDLVITLVSRGDPESDEVLAATYVNYRTVRQRAETALPRAR